jgi:hypothetical protein
MPGALAETGASKDKPFLKMQDAWRGGFAANCKQRKCCWLGYCCRFSGGLTAYPQSATASFASGRCAMTSIVIEVVPHC